MPRQNRVTPFGEIIVSDARGTLMGNRGGCFHDDQGNLTAARWTSARWITCLLDYKGKRRQIMTPGEYTELFFLDEATALAAGHRPCAMCRWPDFTWFAEAWRAANPDQEVPAGAPANAIDRRLHAERTNRLKEKVTYRAPLQSLPTGTFVSLDADPGVAYLIRGPALRRWTPAGYAPERSRVTSLDVTVLTPPSTVETLRAGYVPIIHASAA